MIPLRDLQPRFDPKGGSPKTPIPIPVKNLEGYIDTGGDTGGVWRVVACAAITALIGMTVAWFTALITHGVSSKDMQDYVDKSLANDRQMVALENATQNEKIGILMGQKDRIFDVLKMIQEKHISYDKDLSDDEHKIQILTNYIEAEKFPKK